MDEREAIFRKSVVERLSSPDQLDQLLQVLRPRSWLLLVAIGLLFATALAWSVSGTMTIDVPASGLLLRPGGIGDLPAPVAGRVVELAAAGELLAAGERAATVRPLPAAAASRAEPLAVPVPFAARVVEVLVRPGQVVEAGAPLLSFERADEELRAVLFVDGEVARQVRPGLAVRLASRGGGADEVVVGEVLTVSDHPATSRGLEALLADSDLAERLLAADRRWRVDVRLPPASSAAPRREALPRVSRGEVEGRIVLREVRPIEGVLPWVEIE
jgi:multidrug efflux pump subunit AcrA (membrane-fusion protein)